MSAPSILKRQHRIRGGLTVEVTRVLKGTREASWSGTRAYQTGIDLLVSIHCAKCCCRWLRTVGCTGPVVPTFRVFYSSEDPDAWWSRATDLAATHLESERHG